MRKTILYERGGFHYAVLSINGMNKGQCNFMDLVGSKQFNQNDKASLLMALQHGDIFQSDGLEAPNGWLKSGDTVLIYSTVNSLDPYGMRISPNAKVYEFDISFLKQIIKDIIEKKFDRRFAGAKKPYINIRQKGETCACMTLQDWVHIVNEVTK